MSTPHSSGLRIAVKMCQASIFALFPQCWGLFLGQGKKQQAAMSNCGSLINCLYMCSRALLDKNSKSSLCLLRFFWGEACLQMTVA